MQNISQQKPDEVTVKETSNYELPPEGVHQAVCVDVIDMGEVETQFGVKPQVYLVFQLETDDHARRSDGERFEIARRFNPSLNAKSALRPFLESWRGKKFSVEELQGFKLSVLVGVNSMVQVIHEEGEKGSYAKLQTVTPWSKKYGAPISAENYRRRIQKPAAAAKATNGQASGATQAAVDDDVSF